MPKSSKTGARVLVNLRGKVKGVDERAVGNNVAVVDCVYDLQESEKTSVPARIHEALRAKMSERNLITKVQELNSMWAEGKQYISKDLPMDAPVLDWNYQVTTPYLEVDFGVGKPTRAQPWSIEQVKVMRSLHGGVDVMISKSGPLPAQAGQGIRSWARDKYASLGKALGLSQVILLCMLWSRRRAASKQMLFGGTVLVAACTVVKALLGKRHSRYVESCFKALEQHPRLRPLALPREAARGGA